MRRLVRLLTTALLCAGAALVAPAPASADLWDLTCATTAQANFIPPLTSAGGTVTTHVTGSFSNCLSLNGNYPDLDSATFDGDGVATAVPGVPCSLMIAIEGDAEADWSPATATSVDFTDGALEGDGFTGRRHPGRPEPPGELRRDGLDVTLLDPPGKSGGHHVFGDSVRPSRTDGCSARLGDVRPQCAHGGQVVVRAGRPVLGHPTHFRVCEDEEPLLVDRLHDSGRD
jgi:hypothetical protein